MEVGEVMGGYGGLGDGGGLGGEVLEQHGESENLEADLLEDLDSYLEDIDGRLTISRMVSISVIKGMVRAVEKMAEEKIMEKELEVARMREKMLFQESSDEENEGIIEVSNVRDELNSLLTVILEETMRFRQLGGDIRERINEVSNARNELDSLLKSLPGSESGQLISQGSNDMDNFYRKILSTHVSTSSSFRVENGHLEESNNGMPETWDVAQLGHLDREGLVAHFNSIITNMRRDHESQVQKMTEDYFSLKREYLKEKGSLQHRKDKDLEIVRKKIPEVILKLDDIFVENEKLSTFSNELDSFSSLKDRVNALLLDNHQLRESLSNKKKEVKSLISQISDGSEKMLRHSLAGESLKKLCDLESNLEDAGMKAFVTQKVYECYIRELILNKNNNSEEMEMLCIGSAKDAKDTNKCHIEDSDIESAILQGLCEVIFREAITDAKVIIDDMTLNYRHESDCRIYLEKKLFEREEDLKILIEEKVRLKQEFHLVVGALGGKEKLCLELSDTLTKGRDQLELVSNELKSIKCRVGWLESSLNKRDEEIDVIKGKLAEAFDQVELGKFDMNKAKQKLELMSEELRVSNEERNTLHAIAKKKQSDMAMLEAKENEQRIQMQSVIGLVHRLSREFCELECKVSEDIKQKNSRLEEFSALLQSLIKKNNILRRTTRVYKQKFESECANLQIAENEVDLLADQVDTLLNLLEKIYIALDHYSPILQHYPGIMEILKLVRKELSKESIKFK